MIEFNKDESPSGGGIGGGGGGGGADSEDNAALSDPNCDYILPITQIVAEHQKKQVKFYCTAIPYFPIARLSDFFKNYYEFVLKVTNLCKNTIRLEGN